MVSCSTTRRDVSLALRGDDFTFIGCDKRADVIDRSIQKALPCKIDGRIGSWRNRGQKTGGCMFFSFAQMCGISQPRKRVC